VQILRVIITGLSSSEMTKNQQNRLTLTLTYETAQVLGKVTTENAADERELH